MKDGPGGRVSLPDHRDQGTTDPGGGDGGSRRGQPAWQLPVGRGLRHSWEPSTHAFPPLWSHPTEVRHHHGVFIWVTRSLDLWGSYTLFVSVDCVWLLFWFSCAMVWVIFAAVSLRLLVSSSKISFLYTFVLFVV